VAVGLNHLTGQFTHHIDPDIDRERDALIADLTATGQLGPSPPPPASARSSAAATANMTSSSPTA
jgi:hypothetical protein